jgi:hypothetical protein
MARTTRVSPYILPAAASPAGFTIPGGDRQEVEQHGREDAELDPDR